MTKLCTDLPPNVKKERLPVACPAAVPVACTESEVREKCRSVATFNTVGAWSFRHRPKASVLCPDP